MKFRILAALALFAMMAVATRAYPNNYTAYYTYSLSVDSTGAPYMQVNATVTGTTLPPVPPMSGAYHQARVSATWKGSSNWLYGPQVCTSCNVNLNQSWDFPGNDLCWALGDCTLEMDAQVNCSFVGTFWVVTSGSSGVTLAHSNYDLTLNAGCTAPNGDVMQFCDVKKDCQSGTESCAGPATDVVTKSTCGCGQHFDRLTLKKANFCVPGANTYVDIGTLVVPCS
jgi:hypothetical protein